MKSLIIQIYRLKKFRKNQVMRKIVIGENIQETMLILIYVLYELIQMINLVGLHVQKILLIIIIKVYSLYINGNEMYFHG